ncbi:LTXXQ domain protein [Pseudomonas putida]|uniref:Spy/CpxP family protein refolding chaperone n=1 Tax=Pseudomonas TaxID=286 RepID=UPI0007308938|nr:MULTISPECIES: Spy/CpxP family protein refolding chaperone [Pseudomonas]KTC23972.1 LTXXQ domain protein [Pseudomonas putida]WKL65917.1 Spy/CpxP family protein refolding chaperone [Pseudomonas qingdaonensis]
MRKTLIALMFAAALPTVAMAMPDGGPRHGAEHQRVGAPFAQLDLTREQRQQIRQLMGEQMKSRHEITQRYLAKLPAADQKALKDELKASHDKVDTQIRGMLKPEQQKQFDEMKKKQAERKAEWAEFKAWKAEKASKAQ